MVGIVERLVPEELWELFQRVVPEAPSRPQGGGRRRHGDREVLAAIVFVATSGCTWQQLPSTNNSNFDFVSETERHDHFRWQRDVLNDGRGRAVRGRRIAE